MWFLRRVSGRRVCICKGPGCGGLSMEVGGAGVGWVCVTVQKGSVGGWCGSSRLL